MAVDLVITNSDSQCCSTPPVPGSAIPTFTPQQTVAVWQRHALAMADVNGEASKSDRHDYQRAPAECAAQHDAPGATTPSFAAQQEFSTPQGPRIRHDC